MYFHFKQFSIKQSSSAMKVGTDAVLLGSSTPIHDKMRTVLDIGSGTGVLSLMIAQRLAEAQITAIEIDAEAAEETAFNFKNSSFSDRLTSHHSSFESYHSFSLSNSLFDLILCNPPFFANSQAEGSRKKARDSYSLPADHLLNGANKLLTEDGQFSLIIPYLDEENLLSIARQYGLFPFEIMRVRGRKESKIIRSMIHLKKGKQKLAEKEMYIEIEKRHEYSEEYLGLVEDFLLIKTKSESRE